MSLPPSDWAEKALSDLSVETEHPVAWEDPDRASLSALLLTLGRILWQPKKFFTSLPLTGGLGEPLGFVLVVGTVGLLGSFFWILAQGGDLSDKVAFLAIPAEDYLSDRRVIVGLFLMAPLMAIFWQFFLAISLMWAARLTGPEDISFEAVFRIAAYAQAPAVACLLPFGGSVVANAWNLILLIIGLSKKFNMSTFKACFTFFLAVIFQGMLLLFFGLMSWVLGVWGLILS